MKQKIVDQKPFARTFLGYGIIAILLLIPFHASLTVWLASLGFHYELVRLWKEFLLILLSVAAVLCLFKDKQLFRQLSKDWMVRVIVLFGLVVALNALIVLLSGTVSPKAVGYGLIVDSRLWLFLLIVIVAIRSRVKLPIPRLVLVPAIVVVGLGLMQMSVLPPDALEAIGYGPDTIQPYQAVDNNPDFIRVQSTMRGPNPLGAYLIPVILLLMLGFLKFKNYRWQFATGVIAALTVLFGTHSRSAWIGLMLAVGLFIWWQIRNKWRFWALLAAGFLLIISSVGIYVLRDNDYVQNIFFHSSEDSPSSVSSNEQRARALMMSAKDIILHPLGGGVGSAGPASVYNKDGARLSENFYLQIGQELGVIGLGVYIILTALVIRGLWSQRRQSISLMILACFVGLIAVNLLSHAWSDDVLAYVFGALLAYGLVAYKLDTKSEN